MQMLELIQKYIVLIEQIHGARTGQWNYEYIQAQFEVYKKEMARVTKKNKKQNNRSFSRTGSSRLKNQKKKTGQRKNKSRNKSQSYVSRGSRSKSFSKVRQISPNS